MKCIIEATDDPQYHTCKRCKQPHRAVNVPEKCHRVCRRKGMGDWLAKFFAWLGFKKKPGCGCDKRQQALNRAGARLGL